MFGGHVVKVGVSLFLIELMRRGYLTHLATNGAGSIHDFEIALIGETSEDVDVAIEDRTFGFAEETGAMMNKAINQSGKGYGAAIGELISKENMRYKDYSIFYHARKLGIPVTVHAAIGTDVIHTHPKCDGAKLGSATYHDFKLFTDVVSELEGGVMINLGSAVIMPEVFLKALSVARNLGYTVDKFTAANLDMIDHHRPRVNVVERPTSRGGVGYVVIGRHESTVPTLYHHILRLR
jgi:hypothetical protein